MANRKCTGLPPRMQKSKISKDFHIHVCGEPFLLDRKLMASRSAKLDLLLKENPQKDISHLLQDIPTDPKTFELVARFCHGFKVSISTENVIRVWCLADYLGMTEKHSSNNLLNKAITFFKQDVIPSWNKSVRALKNAEHILQQVLHLGIVVALADSIITKVLANPCLLGEPIKNITSDDDGKENENVYRTNARMRPFGFDWQTVDLTTLSVPLYEPIIRAIIQRRVPSKYAAASLCQYLRKRVFSSTIGELEKSFDKGNSQREAIEAVERLLPQERGLISCTLLFEMLRFAIDVEASHECRNGFEVRIGKQLDQANVKDLLIPCLGYTREEVNDTHSLRRILKHFYCNYSCLDTRAIISVAELIEDFLAEVASDINLKKSTFIALVDMAFAASVKTQKNCDGIYRAISISLEKHTYLTESEKEEVCWLLDFSKMSREVCQHAATNKQLPLKAVIQVVFVHQLQLRETIENKVHCSNDGLIKLEEEETRTEMEKMSCKVTELEKECSIMSKEIEDGLCSRGEKAKGSVWKEMKRKFGCISTSLSTMHDYNCHVKKKKVNLR